MELPLPITSKHDDDEMDVSVLERVMGEKDEDIAPWFRGVFSLDEFIEYSANLIQYEDKNVFVFNSEPVAVVEGHWLLMYFDGTDPDNKYLCFFDSFARPPSFYDVNLQKYFDNLTYALTERPLVESPYQVQSDRSNVCGLYVTFVARGLLSRKYIGGRLPALIEENFSSRNLRENDLKVLNWFDRQRYGEFVKKHCASNDCVSLETLLERQRQHGGRDTG